MPVFSRVTIALAVIGAIAPEAARAAPTRRHLKKKDERRKKQIEKGIKQQEEDADWRNIVVKKAKKVTSEAEKVLDTVDDLRWKAGSGLRKQSLSTYSTPAGGGALGLRFGRRRSPYRTGLMGAGFALGLWALYHWAKSKEDRGPGGKGRWVFDRSMGGKRIWVAEGDPTPAGYTSSAVTSSDAAAMADNLLWSAEAAREAGGARAVAREKVPALWWRPSKPGYVSETRKPQLMQRAQTLAMKLLDEKLQGRDWDPLSLVELRDACRQSGESVAIKGESSKDSLFRAAVEAAISTATTGGTGLLAGTEPAVFVSDFAGHVGVKYDKAQRIASGAVAAKAKNLLLSTAAMARRGEDGPALYEICRLGYLLNAFPFPADAPETEMVAGGLQLNQKEKESVLSLFVAACTPEHAKSVAEMLDIDPSILEG